MDYLDISDASITASSERDVNHAAKRVRINRYLDYACAWSAAPDDHKPWIQFDMEQEVTVWGVLVKPPCIESYSFPKFTSLKVTMSEDGVKWTDVSDTLIIFDPNDQQLITWFDEPLTAQNWKLQIFQWYSVPTMKADLIGKPKGKRWFSSLYDYISYATIIRCFILRNCDSKRCFSLHTSTTIFPLAAG